MEQERSASLHHLHVRLNELRSQNRLISLQVNEIQSFEDYRRGESYGKLTTDANWMEALMTLVDSGSLAPQIVLQLWGLKDQSSRDLNKPKDF